MALIDKASLLMVPSTYEAGKLYNILPSGNRAPDSTGENSGYDQTRADFDFDRGSNAAATRIGSDGLLKKYRENLLTESNNFSDSDWTKYGGVTLTSGQADKDGGTDAWLLTKPAAGFTGIGEAETITGVITFSVFAKANTHSKVTIRLIGTPDVNVIFNLSDGTIFGGTSLGWIDRKIESVENGWYKCSLTLNNSGATNAVIYPDEITNTTTGSIYIQNAQLEASMVATDYLDSTSVTAKAGVLIDLPRIDYSSGAGALILEPSRANLIQYSEYFGTWASVVQGTASAPTITTNYDISPDGKQNATRIQFDLNGGTTLSDRVIIRQSLAIQSDYYFSVWMKSATGSEQKILWHSTADDNETTITSDWQRFEFDRNSTSVGWAGLSLRGSTSSVDTADILVWGFQVERGSYKTSYIPNHSGTGGVTRAADLCNNGGSAESINSVEGVLYAEIAALADDEINRHITLWDGTDTNRLVLKYDNQSNVVQVFNRVGGIETAFLGHSLADITISHKIAVRYKANDYALVIDGVEVDTDTSSSTWSVSVFNDIKFSNGSGSDFYGNVKQLAVFNEALSDSELATLTTL